MDRLGSGCGLVSLENFRYNDGMATVMATVSDLCKLLRNPLRQRLLSRIYLSLDGVNVGFLVDMLSDAGLNQSGVSQYLKQMEQLGVIRREQAGRYVNYKADTQRANERVARAVRLIFESLRRARRRRSVEFAVS